MVDHLAEDRAEYRRRLVATSSISLYQEYLLFKNSKKEQAHKAGFESSPKGNNDYERQGKFHSGILLDEIAFEVLASQPDPIKRHDYLDRLQDIAGSSCEPEHAGRYQNALTLGDCDPPLGRDSACGEFSSCLEQLLREQPHAPLLCCPRPMKRAGAVGMVEVWLLVFRVLVGI
ncbi:hypothetical protein MMC18_008368 [Xylographa bjoerkii]|nr:hypothetical protein [Xylographa bjoerkii]